MQDRTIAVNEYYTCLEHLTRRFEKYGRKDRFHATTIEEYEVWKTTTRITLSDLIGLQNMESCELNARVLEKVEIEEGIVREKVLLMVEPEVYMPVYILIPQKKKEGERLKCFLTPPGHQGGGKYSIAGLREIPAINDKIDFFNYDYGLQLAKLGYVALCNDNRGFGERREKALQNDEEKSFLGCTCFHLAHMAEPLGQTVIGMCTWDLMRLIDYVIERDEWDIEDIGCLGFSGGGMQTLWLSALDDRIKKVVISGYMYGYKDSLLKLNGNCSCNYVPHLWEHVDMGDIGALIAPRPVMIQSAKNDHLNGERGIANAIEQVEIMRKAYALYQKEDRLFHDIVEGPHRWHDEHLKPFLKNQQFVSE